MSRDRIALGVALVLFVPATARGDAPTSVPHYDARTFYETTAYFGASFSADESRILVTSDRTGVFNAYSLPVRGGELVPVTTSKTSAAFSAGYFPHDDRALYTQDEGGNELNHVYVKEAAGAVRDLTPGKGLKASFAGWSGDLRSCYVVSNERDRGYFDLYRYDGTSYARTLFFKNAGGFASPRASRDGRRAALLKEHTNTDNDLYLWDAGQPDKEPVKITSHQGDVEHRLMDFSPDSERLYYTSDEGGQFQRAWEYDLKTGARRIAAQDKWDVWGLHLSWRGRYREVQVNADARTVVTITDTQRNEPLNLPVPPGGQVTGVTFSRSENLLAFYAGSDRTPEDLHVLDLRSGEQHQLTHSLNPKIKPEHLVSSEVIRYPSYDKLPIPALLYRPHGAQATNKVPALVWVHGGPGGQSRVGYDPDIQFLVNHGYAVLAVNNRGSTGYGKEFFHMDDRRHGEVDLQDVVFGRRYLEDLDWVDGKRIGIIGGSYGGYMVCAALAFAPDAFDVGIDIFGVTNWLRTLESIPPWWASFRDSLYAELGDPKTDRERLRRISPLFHAKNIRKPLLVVQGANDPRVLKVESDELVAAARANGVPVEYIVFPDEGHGFLRRENRITAAEAYLKFLDRHLKGS
jgi:dipeptidyl aminopeptidase/acylaminoacyl peptidase